MEDTRSKMRQRERFVGSLDGTRYTLLRFGAFRVRENETLAFSGVSP